jgi:sodium transport system ATP-binding protein
MIAVTTSKLSKRFKTIDALKNLSLKIEDGQIFGLLGPNGAGKTTAIRLIATTLSATSGSATVAGHDIATDAMAVRRAIGVLNAEIGLYIRLTGRENLAYFGQLYGLDKATIDRRIKELDQWLELGPRILDQRAGSFSTGMKQKLAIARSVIHDPRIIILDEPTSGLDVLAAQTVLQFMKEARDQGKLVIFSTHQMDDAERLCDRVAIIHKGRLIATGNVDELKQQAKASSLAEAFLTLVNKTS